MANEIKEKTAEIVSTVEWPYSHEFEIQNKFHKAYVSIKKKTLDVPKTPCTSCLKLFPDSKMKHVDTFHINIEELFEHQENSEHKFIWDYCQGKFASR